MPVLGTVRYLVQTVLLLVAVGAASGSLRALRTASIRLQALRGVLLLGTTGTFWLALRALPLPDAVALSALSPVIATVLAVPLLGERPRTRQMVAVGLGTLGAILVIQPGTSVFTPASLLPVGTALCYASFEVVTRRLGSRDTAVGTLFYTGLVCLAGMAGGLLLGPIGPLDPAFLALVGVMSLGGLAGHYFIIRALQLAPVPQVTPLSYTGLLWGVIYGYVLFGQLPNAMAALGMAVIAVGGLLLVGRPSAHRGDPTLEAEVVPWA